MSRTTLVPPPSPRPQEPFLPGRERLLADIGARSGGELRLDAARTLLTRGLPIKTIAGKVGLNSPARLGQAFERRFGMAPSLFREMHRAA